MASAGVVAVESSVLSLSLAIAGVKYVLPLWLTLSYDTATTP
jgi:hypothetical protein